jgi:hypothetical protein
MVYGMVLVDFCLVIGLLWVYEVRTVWHTTRLPEPALAGPNTGCRRVVYTVLLVENKRPLAFT